MATNPIDPNYSRKRQPEFRDPDLEPVGKGKGPIPWGLIPTGIVAVTAFVTGSIRETV